ncbi:MAG: PEGA domain-containing protein, partial [Acidobacteriota bacterium]
AYGGPSGNPWSYDVGEPIRFVSAAESYVALVTETGKLDVLGQSRPGTSEPQPANAGGLDLAVDPEDARVWLDGSYLGSGGRSLAGLRPGTHRLRLVHPDCRRLDAEVEIAPGGTAPLSLVLERRSDGPLLIESTPSAADVFLDGERKGPTPYTAYNYPPGQVVKVTVSKRGYRSVSRTLALREEGAKLDVALKYAPPLAGLFGLAGYTGTGAIRGWREADIREGRVEGEPYRPGDGNAFAAAAGFFEVGPQRLRLFGRGAVSTHEDVFGEGEGGLWFALNRRLRVEVGASYLRLGLNHTRSEPPRRQREGQRGSVEDRSAPLEEWSHPIPRVFVENEPPSYLLGKLRLRPRVGLLVELGAGLLQDARLRGTALVEDAGGHLVRDTARSYDFEGRNGGILDARLQLALGTFPFWKLHPSTALDVRFQHRWADFGSARESTGALILGIGVLSFNSRPEAAP